MIVLDTHAFIWFASGSQALGTAANDLIEQAARAGDVGIPDIVCWEIALLEKKRSIDFGRDAHEWLRDALALDGFRLLLLSADIAFDTVRMEWSHRDPADRMITATARCLDAMLVTADRAILAYATAGHVAAIDARR